MGEYYNVSSLKMLPTVYPSILANDIPYYYKTGTRHFNYMHTPTNLWGTWTLNQYMLAQLLWNHQTKSDQLLKDYFSRYYPTTTEHTRNLYTYLEKATSNFKAFKHYAGKNIYKMRPRLMKDSVNIFPLDHLHYESYLPAKNDGQDVLDIMEDMKLARREIDASMLLCKNKIEESRLIDDERRFAYCEDMVNFYYHLIRIALFQRNGLTASAKQEFGKAKEYSERLKNITDLVGPIPGKGKGDANATDGLDATQAMDVFQYFQKKYDN
jgi:hypothetical protein